MTTLKKIKLKLSAWRLVALAVAVVGVGSLVAAYAGGGPTTVIENAQNVTVSAPAAPEVDSPILGATTNPVSPFNYQCLAGSCTYEIGASFPDATTTIVSVANPFRAATSSATDVIVDSVTGLTAPTTTVDLVRLTVTTAATTTFEVDCTAAANTGTTSTPAIVDTEALIPTSTIGVIESGVVSTTNRGNGSLVLANSTPVYKIMLTPDRPYLVCKVWQPYGTSLDAFTSGVNAFDGRFLLRFSRQQY